MTSISRRGFLASGAAAAATIVPRHVLGGPGHVAPSDRVNVALVGAGGRGQRNASELMKLPDVRITTVIDPAEHWSLDAFYYRGVAGRASACAEIEKHYQKSEPAFKVKQATDYRKVLADDRGDIDAMLIATPDHLHALISIAAMKGGKGVYCEKPLTHNIAEARLVASVAKETGAATQMGNQGHSRDSIRETIELVRGGAIGKVTEVHAWVPATRWNKSLVAPPTDPQPMPQGLDWDLWCGPREVVPFHSAYAPVSWRDFWQFGLGAMGDFGCHDLDSAVWGLELGMPERIEMHPAGQLDPAMIPFGEAGVFDFATSNQGTPVKIYWYSGGLKPRRPEALPADERLPNRGVLFVGESGIMVCGGAGGTPTVHSNDSDAKVVNPEATLQLSNGHHRDWIDAVKGGPPASSHFDYAAKLTEITLLGVLALRTGEVIHWDQGNLKARGVAKADPIIHGHYREGWKLQAG